MSFYRSRFDADWSGEMDRDEATHRAYAIGVAEKLGEDNRRELEALYAAVGSNYGRSLVELAYQEGRQEARAVGADKEDEAVWSELVEGEKTEVVAPESLTEGREGLPEAIGLGELFERMDADSREAVDRPDFLEK